MPTPKRPPITSSDYLLWGLTTEDAQNVAQETLDRKLTAAELRRVDAYFKNFCGWDWAEAMENAIERAIEPRRKKRKY